VAESFLTSRDVPFCKGCTHSRIALSTDAALQKLGLRPLDVIIVTDIGCHGIIDKFYTTHTVHGLHGRSVAIGAGIRMGLPDRGKKVIVFVGDGGATIGLTHIVAAAHRNIDMTVIVHNNMLYGMTGGQPSDLTPPGFKTPTMTDDDTGTGFNLCTTIEAVGAGYVTRIVGMGDFSDRLAEAIEAPGFSLVEVMEMCTNYGLRANKGLKLSNLIERTGLEPMISSRPDVQPFSLREHAAPASLLDGLKALPTTKRGNLDRKFRVVLGGSAGEGVQSATRLFAEAAIQSGLHVTTKGSYPVTVGTGYSCAEIILSPEPILSTVVYRPDALVITSEAGLAFCERYLGRLAGDLFLEESLALPGETTGRIQRRPFRDRVGGRSAALFALMVLLQESDLFPAEQFAETIKCSKFGRELEVDEFLSQAKDFVAHS
jgi:2-oxoglutarate ferredoxin oxidoreductase subunit beta